MGGNTNLCKVPVILVCIACFVLIGVISAKRKDATDDPEEKWKKKDVRDYTDADLERLLDQWEVTLLNAP